MKRLLCAGAALMLAGCGYVGDPLPPLANVPAKVSDLAAIQRGGRLIVQFTIPTLTTEGKPIPPPLTLDLRAGTADQFNENQWAASARKIPPAANVGGCDAKAAQPCLTARYEFASADWTAKEVILGVRAVAGNGKQSGWSNFVIVPVVLAPDKPGNVTPAATQQGVHLAWSARGATFRVYRKTGDKPFAQVAEVTTPEWTDTATEFGTSYTYQVQTIVKMDNRKEAESELSDEVSITPRDTFPPAVPKGLQGSTAPSSIELNWDGNVEDDLAGYRVYRSEGGGAMEKIADVSAIPSYSDRKVEHGKTYRYAISAVDRAGNESGRSGTIEVALP